MTAKQYLAMKPALRRILLAAWGTAPTEIQLFQTALVLVSVHRTEGAA